MKTTGNRKFFKITALVGGSLLFVDLLSAFLFCFLLYKNLINLSNVCYYLVGMFLGLVGVLLLIQIEYYRKKAKKFKQSSRLWHDQIKKTIS